MAQSGTITCMAVLHEHKPDKATGLQLCGNNSMIEGRKQLILV
jgi:hypothetical protein